MRDLRGHTALVTGASGGLGRHLTRALVDAGMDVVVSGRNVAALEALRDELLHRYSGVHVVPADLARRDDVLRLVRDAAEAAGPLDVLVNNAGIEQTSRYASLDPEAIESVVAVNLVAPMLLTRIALPGMLERGRGHVVLMASMAGKIGTSCTEPYTASKAGLIGFARSLRVELRDAPVGVSVIAPGFVAGDGMYGRMVDEDGIPAPKTTPVVGAERVARAMLRAVRRDLPDVNVYGTPIRPLLAVQDLSPRLFGRIAARLGVDESFERLADRRTSRLT